LEQIANALRFGNGARADALMLEWVEEYIRMAAPDDVSAAQWVHYCRATIDRRTP
jgi:hypothetical protein